MLITLTQLEWHGLVRFYEILCLIYAEMVSLWFVFVFAFMTLGLYCGLALEAGKSFGLMGPKKFDIIFFKSEEDFDTVKDLLTWNCVLGQGTLYYYFYNKELVFIVQQLEEALFFGDPVLDTLTFEECVVYVYQGDRRALKRLLAPRLSTRVASAVQALVVRGKAAYFYYTLLFSRSYWGVRDRVVGYYSDGRDRVVDYCRREWDWILFSTIFLGFVFSGSVKLLYLYFLDWYWMVFMRKQGTVYQMYDMLSHPIVLFKELLAYVKATEIVQHYVMQPFAVGLPGLLWFCEQLVLFLIVVLPVLIGVAYFTLAERKIMAAMQRRLGPNVVGLWGVFQPLADGLKLFVKQVIVPNKSQRQLFLFAPVYSFALALTAWSVMPFGTNNAVVANIDLGVLFLLCVSTMSVYGLIIAGWSSNSKYAFLGALRAAAQMISYDVPFGLILLSIIVYSGSCNLSIIVSSQAMTMWYIVPFWPLAIMFFVSVLAETNRAPFDLTEAEAELVSGYNVEYSAVGFTLFFLAEYSNMLLMSMYCAILFFGGWTMPGFEPSAFWLGLKVISVAFLFIWVRASLPRYRYDQLMLLGWKCFLPLSLGFFVFVNGVMFL